LLPSAANRSGMTQGLRNLEAARCRKRGFLNKVVLMLNPE
jgi:hypothetical protein